MVYNFALAINKLGILPPGVTFIPKQRFLSPLEMHTHTLLGHFTGQVISFVFQ